VAHCSNAPCTPDADAVAPSRVIIIVVRPAEKNKQNSHGRDNKLHIWNLPSHPPSTVRGSASAPDTLTLELGHSLDVNALNFCRFSLLPLDARKPSSTSTSTDPRAFVAVPNLVESSSASARRLSCEMHPRCGFAMTRFY
jgi:hypothetical protein